ncbi:MAG TPA: diacylglycerol kinase family protein [Gemmatimonadales bacterium]
MARVLLIMNPMAARTDPSVVGTVSTVLAREGWEVDVVGTDRPEHAADLARMAVNDGIERIAVYGGDGTAMEAVRGAMGHDVLIGLIPGGTGNVLAGNLRLPRDPTKAALVVARGRPRAVDLGRLARPDGPRYFAVASGAGFDATVMAGTTAAAKRRWRTAAYLAHAWNSARIVRNNQYRATIDGTVYEGAAATILVANCGEFIPPYFRFRNGIAFDDGQLDVLMFRAEGLRQSLAVVWQIARVGDDATGRIRHLRGREIQIATEPVQPVQFDGEQAGDTPFAVDVLPGALRVLVP